MPLRVEASNKESGKQLVRVCVVQSAPVVSLVREPTAPCYLNRTWLRQVTI